MILWLEFLIATTLILVSGTQLTRYGDVIAEKTGLSRLWLGMILIGAVTSLPELATGLSAVTIEGLPDIAVGGVLGSCVFNVFILGLIDALSRKVPLSSKTNQANILAAGFSIFFLSGVSLSLFLGDRMPSFGWIGISSPLIILGYLITMRTIFKFEKRRATRILAEVGAPLYGTVTVGQAVFRYILNAAIVVGAAVFLPGIAEGIAASSGLGQAFVGNIFIAISTSLPELTVSIAAVRLGTIDMAVGNLFGSNLFNILILAIDDIFYWKGPLLHAVESQHLLSAIAAIAMTGFAIAGLIYNAEKKRFFWAWDSFGVILIYLVNLSLLYLLR